MSTKTTTKDYYECKRCEISTDTKNRMCPCPRSGCEAVITGTLTTTVSIVLDTILPKYRIAWNTTDKLFKPDKSLMTALNELKDEDTAKEWYRQYLEYHDGQDQGVQYLIGYFANVRQRNNLRRWLQ